MKRLISILCLALVSLTTLNAAAQAPQPPEVAARSYILVDVTTGKTLAEKDADAPADPASLTKLMTAYLVFAALKDGKLKLEQTLPVSKRAWDERKGGASVMFIDTTMTPTVDDLLKGMIVQSGNDASVALAEGVSGTVESFVDAMNKQAVLWSLKNTKFKNVAGMSETGHATTARDLSVIAGHIITDFPQYYPYYSMRQFTFNKIKQDNRNMLLGRDPNVDGMKTGYTDAAGYCLVASAVRDMPNGKRRLLSVVLGTSSRDARANESQKLLNWGYTAYDAVKLFDAGQPMEEAQIWKGSQGTIKVGREAATVVTVPSGSAGKVTTQLVRTDPLMAPITKGQQVGTLKVLVGDQVAAELPVLALEAVNEGGFFRRLWDSIRLWIR